VPRHYVAPRTSSGKFGFGPVFRAHLSIHRLHSLGSSLPRPAWGYFHKTVRHRQANSSVSIAEGLGKSTLAYCENHCVSSDICDTQPACLFALLSPGFSQIRSGSLCSEVLDLSACLLHRAEPRANATGYRFARPGLAVKAEVESAPGSGAKSRSGRGPVHSHPTQECVPIRDGSRSKLSRQRTPQSPERLS